MRDFIRRCYIGWKYFKFGFHIGEKKHMPEAFIRELNEWSEETFGEDHTLGTINHLRKEAEEYKEAYLNYCDTLHKPFRYPKEINNAHLEFIKEAADVQMLLWDGLKREGIHFATLLWYCQKKLEINKKRNWGPKNEEGFFEHVKDNNNEG